MQAALNRRKNKLAPWDDSRIATCITTDGGNKGHPSGTRDFTEREIATLQSFPQHHIFYGNAIRKQIGNAVPPLVAKIIFRAIIKHLERQDGVVREVVPVE
jgi:DNA (cytosine-5)-methyltransferase 1